MYGIPDEVENLKDVFIIDDACQAALSFRGSKRIGLSNDKLGIFSMGRGKAYASAGGGLLLVPKSFEKLTEVIDKEFSKFEISSTLDFFRNLIKSFLYYFLEMPFFYRFILLVPGLGIGETLIDKDFQIKRGGMFEYLTLKLSVRNEQTRSFMQQNVVASYLKLFSEKLDAVKIFEKIKENNFSLIRFPVLLERTERKHLFSKQGKRLKQFGVTCSYPTLIKYYFEEESFSNFEEKTENAEDISQRIVTLPVGPYIGHLVQESIKQLITNMEN